MDLLLAHHCNGFGFQVGWVDPPTTIIVAFVTRGFETINIDTETVAWQNTLGTPHVKLDSWLGRYYICVDVAAYQLIPAVIQHALDQKMHVQLHMVLKPVYNPGETFDPLQVEARFIASVRSQSATPETPWDVLRDHPKLTRLLHPWNWQTSEGQQFCQDARAALPRGINAEEDRTLNFFAWPTTDAVARKHRLLQYGDWWFGPRLAPAAPIVPDATVDEQKAAVREQKVDPVAVEMVMCAVCDECTANTMVLPCGHIVVCVQCSDRLETTGDKAKCLQCRNDINTVICDNREPKVIRQ